MKKIALICALPAVLILTGALHAAPVSPQGHLHEGRKIIEESIPDKSEISLRIETDFLLEREFDSDETVVSGNFHGLRFSYSPMDQRPYHRWRWPSISLTYGKISTLIYEAEIAAGDIEFKLTNQDYIGAGLSWSTIQEVLPIQIGLSVQHRQFVVSGEETDVTIAAVENEGETRARWSELQVAFVAMKRFHTWAPYLGMKWSNVKTSASMSVGGTTYRIPDTESDAKFGMFVGCSVAFGTRFSLDVEHRFLDESAFSAALTFTF